MRLLRVLLVPIAFASLPVAPATAHDLSPTITPSSTDLVEDSDFAIGLAGDVSTLGQGYVHATIRPIGGATCAPRPAEDPGSDIAVAGTSSGAGVTGAFSLTGRYIAPTPGMYLICAWVEGPINDFGPPSSAVVSVRAPLLQLVVSAPARVQRYADFPVNVAIAAEASRYLTILIARSSTCSVSSDALRNISERTFVVIEHELVSNNDSETIGMAINDPGRYLICAFLEERRSGGAAAYSIEAATIDVLLGPRRCGNAGGRKHITSVTATNVSCLSAKALARRWASRRTPPRRLGAYTCSATSGRVTCVAARGKSVSFRFGRVPR